MTLESLLTTAPDTAAGIAIDLDDWRLSVEALLPATDAALWDVTDWDEVDWGQLAWVDITGDVRGIEWTRGADEYRGRPRIGIVTLTLASPDRKFDPWNPLTETAQAGYFAPGTIIRCGVQSATYTGVGLWIPQWTVIVDRWEQTSVGSEADFAVNIIGYETARDLAEVDDNALASAVGAGDTLNERMTRLLDAADWPYGYIESTQDSGIVLQSTDMADNRLAEIYRTADSTDHTVRSARDGRLMAYTFDYPGAVSVSVWPLLDVSSIVLGVDDVPAFGVSRSLSGGVDYQVVKYDYDTFRTYPTDEGMVNDARYARVGGTQQVAENADSIARFGRRTQVRNDLLCTTDGAAANLAAYNVARKGANALRVASVDLTPWAWNDDSNYLAAIAADIGVLAFVYPPRSTAGTSDPYMFATLSTMTHRIRPRGPERLQWDMSFGFDTRVIYNLPGQQL